MCNRTYLIPNIYGAARYYNMVLVLICAHLQDSIEKHICSRTGKDICSILICSYNENTLNSVHSAKANTVFAYSILRIDKKESLQSFIMLLCGH